MPDTGSQIAPRSLPYGVQYVNNEGELGVMSGRVEINGGTPPVITSWVQRTHPLRPIWTRDEGKERASYIGTRQHLAPFLVPHRFEGNKEGRSLSRARLAYSIGLNSAYLSEIFGHIRNTPAHYTWGILSTAQEDQDTTKEPTGGDAVTFWRDATNNGVNWTNFFEGKVLEWMLTSPGGLILVDSNLMPEAGRINKAVAARSGVRPSFKFIPYSWVEDFGRDARGFWWIKISEVADVRKPKMEGEDNVGYEQFHLIYTLTDTGTTEIARYNDKGEQQGRAVTQNVRDINGIGILPIVPVRFGEHPDIDFMGTGALMGLDDIIIDLFNLLTETREAYRDVVFTFLTYRGGDLTSVQSQLEQGGRLVNLGDSPNSELKAVGAEGSEVASGLSLIELGIKNWAISAKRKATEFQTAAGGPSGSASGVSLKAEFQLDLIPMMISITEQLDQYETQAMFILAQLEGKSPQEAAKLKVRRETQFQMEQEASRIARIVDEFLKSIPGMPAALLEQLIMRWAESLDFLDLNQEVKMADGSTKILRDAIKEQAAEIAEADQTARMIQNQFGILGTAGIGAAAGGGTNGGGNPRPPARGGTPPIGGGRRPPPPGTGGN